MIILFYLREKRKKIVNIKIIIKNRDNDKIIEKYIIFNHRKKKYFLVNVSIKNFCVLFMEKIIC